MAQIHETHMQGEVDSMLTMVFALLVLAIGYVVSMVGFSEVHRYVAICGAASIVCIVAYGASNHVRPISKSESRLFMVVTNVVLAVGLYHIYMQPPLVVITALSYISVLVSVVLSGVRLLRGKAK